MSTYTTVPVKAIVNNTAPGSPDAADPNAPRGATAPADGNAAPAAATSQSGVPLPADLGPNNERLEDAAPRLVNALRELVNQFRQEGIVARRHEIRRIRQARLFWQGLQYAWWNPQDMNWHLPWEAKSFDSSTLEEMPRYQFVTNLYQAFGLSFISVISQDVPATRFYPQSTMNEADISTAKAASEVAALVEQNNQVQQLLTGVGFYLWTDGKIGGYVRYVADGQRFGWRDELVLDERWVRLGQDAYVCPQCGNRSDGECDLQGLKPLGDAASDVAAKAATPWNDGMSSAAIDGDVLRGSGLQPRQKGASSSGASAPEANDFIAGGICSDCGAPLGEKDFHAAPLVPIPLSVGTRRVPNGQEVISIVGGLELNTPVWANEQHEFPYLQWQMEVHRAN